MHRVASFQTSGSLSFQASRKVGNYFKNVGKVCMCKHAWVIGFL